MLHLGVGVGKFRILEAILRRSSSEYLKLSSSYSDREYIAEYVGCPIEITLQSNYILTRFSMSLTITTLYYRVVIKS
jgi:hypothetical protein